jgi:hypothetical protein
MPLEPPVMMAARSLTWRARLFEWRVKARGDRLRVAGRSLTSAAVTWRRLLILVALAAAVVPAGCGGDDEGDSSASPPPVARPEDFPDPAGRTLGELQKRYGTSGPVLSPAMKSLQLGKNRFGFGLFTRSREQIADAPVAVYVAPVTGGPAKGPFAARYESLDVEPQFRSQSVAADRDAAKSVYVADLEFEKPGQYYVLGLARLDDRLVAATPAGPPLAVLKDDPVVDVGERAPLTHTPTQTSVGGDIAKIDTREPPSTMHDEDLAAVLGKKPAVLLFATPALCQSRVCGPVVDIAEQVKAQHADDAAWIHMEIFNENEVEKGYRPQVVKWALPSEPWVFTIDREGKIAARIEGAFSANELEAALKKATKE